MKEHGKPNGLRVLLYFLLVAVMVYVVVYMPTPYLIYQPGSAEEIKPMITVENGDTQEKGSFMLTTVSASYANIALLAYSAFNADSEIVQKEKRLGDQTREEYAATQVFYMNSSQSLAVEAAYHAAGIDYNIVSDYIFVLSVPDKSGNSSYFRPGDRLISVNGESTTDNTRLAELLGSLEVGEKVEVKLERAGKDVTETVPLVAITDNKTGATRPGLGVMIATMQKIQPENSDHEVTFAATNIGGPSAGLMFTMEIYNQLTPGDLSKGYRTAGTGTITKDGIVGPIGGIVHKIVAADRERAELFFVPRKNYDDAQAKAESIGTDMKLIPVDKLQDAIDYMTGLPSKS
ncbi:SepM family pheromone-processing serine protease [Paenibacillus lemnae]|uniref:endopeptidase La n=1 Tax=Paenibacillus lemnae TaxID=1330551 RepID=A0A848M8F5_PAELE|nr:SepM family pheromone-processing serine protease [Paenibacillus lemnae]NMO96491.1 PDZ domain-containing protein [Paenibacillus lemnae]